METQEINILVIKPSSLGDVLHAFPAVSLLKKHYPNSKIDWVINPEFANIVDFHKDVDNTIIFPRKKFSKLSTFFPALFSLRKTIRQKKYDIVIDLQGLIRSSIVAKFADCEEVYGFAKPKESLATLFYKHKIEIEQDSMHAIEKNVELVNKALSMNYKVPVGTVGVLEEHKLSTYEKLELENISTDDICVGIVAGARWESKKWPPGFFAKVIDAVANTRQDVKFLIIGAPSDSEIAQKIIKESSSTNVISMAGKTSICELVELIRRCKLVLTNDSGPMHIAAALNVKTLALFGPTDPDKTGPYGEGNIVITAEDLECLKCLKRECPSGDQKCHSAININHVSKLIINNI